MKIIIGEEEGLEGLEECYEVDEEKFEECEYKKIIDDRYYCCPFPEWEGEDPEETEFFEETFF